MPRIDNTRAAVTHFKEKLQADGSYHTYVPEDFGKVHAIVRVQMFGRDSLDWQRISTFTETNYEGRYSAACDKIMRVVYKFPFNNEDSDACDLCVQRVQTWSGSPEKYWRELSERQQRWRAKEARKLDEWARSAHRLPDELDDYRDKAYDED